MSTICCDDSSQSLNVSSNYKYFFHHFTLFSVVELSCVCMEVAPHIVRFMCFIVCIFRNCTKVYILLFLLSSLSAHYALKAITSEDGHVESLQHKMLQPSKMSTAGMSPFSSEVNIIRSTIGQLD